MAAPVTSTCVNGMHTFESLYNALRAQAKYYLRMEQNASSMSPTVLVHEAWISLAKSKDVKVVDSAHYAKLVSRVMKNLLIDHARRKRSISNGGAMQRVEWNEAIPALGDDDERLLAVAAALDKLALQSPQLAELVELRYFAGFTEAEAGQILGISGRTVRRQWSVARLRLLAALQSGGKEQGDAAA
jgi:RNA polymerase sigma factor (TIGR02999 family)